MEASRLAQLHATLEAGAAARGSHGGLGSQKSQPKKRKAETEATQALLGGGGKKANREFHTTTAGAVAAGHWDPWARPVEFKMKEVNQRVGGLYSMFVKGGTMGGTIAQPEAAARKEEKRPGKKAKGKKAADGSADNASKEQAGTGDAEAFNWKKAIKAQLRAAEGQEMVLKRLRKAVIATCVAQGAAGGADKPSLRATFAKKLEKTAGVVTVGDHVRLETK